MSNYNDDDMFFDEFDDDTFAGVSNKMPEQQSFSEFEEEAPKLDEVNTQGSGYNGPDLDNVSNFENGRNGRANKRVQRTNRVRREEDTESTSVNKKLILIIAGGVLAFLLIVIAAMALADKKEANEQARAEELLEEEQEAAFEYSMEDVEQLRLNGYTGDEIEENELKSIPAAQLIEEAKAARQAQYEAEIKPYFDGASEQFLSVYNKTWLGQPELVFDPTVESFGYYTDVQNLDYEKVPPTGYQLFLKIYLGRDGKAFFMSVTPEQWLELPDSGNIVVEIQYTATADSKRIITDVREIQN